MAAYAILIVVSFLLHLVWETLHIGLYSNYEKLEGVVPVYVHATLGDVLYTLIAVMGYAAYHNSLHIIDIPLQYSVLAALGFCIALFVEYKAMYLQRWTYTARMPIVPFLKVGASPLVQMTVLLPLSVYSSMLLYAYLFA